MKPNARRLKICHKIIISIFAHGREMCTYALEDLFFAIAVEIKHTHLSVLFKKGR